MATFILYKMPRYEVVAVFTAPATTIVDSLTHTRLSTRGYRLIRQNVIDVASGAEMSDKVREAVWKEMGFDPEPTWPEPDTQ